MKQEQGFTLIELVVVIVILGILAAVAVPKFVSLQSDARAAVVRGMEASVNSAAVLVHAKALALGVSTGNIPAGNIEGVTGALAVVNGYPTNASITQVVTTTGNASSTPGVVGGAKAQFNVSGVTTAANCQVLYTEAAAGDSPAIVGNISDCN